MNWWSFVIGFVSGIIAFIIVALIVGINDMMKKMSETKNIDKNNRKVK